MVNTILALIIGIFYAMLILRFLALMEEAS